MEVLPSFGVCWKRYGEELHQVCCLEVLVKSGGLGKQPYLVGYQYGDFQKLGALVWESRRSYCICLFLGAVCFWKLPLERYSRADGEWGLGLIVLLTRCLFLLSGHFLLVMKLHFAIFQLHELSQGHLHLPECRRKRSTAISRKEARRRVLTPCGNCAGSARPGFPAQAHGGHTGLCQGALVPTASLIDEKTRLLAQSEPRALSGTGEPAETLPLFRCPTFLQRHAWRQVAVFCIEPKQFLKRILILLGCISKKLHKLWF